MNLSPLDAAGMAVETMMRKFSAEDLPPKGRFHYHQGVFLSGVYKIWELTKEKRYFDYVKRWIDSVIDENGEILDWDPSQLDNIQPGILLYPLYRETGDERYAKALHTLCPTVLRFPRCDCGGFWHKEKYPYQMWLDGLYMGGPICAEYAKTFDRPEYFNLVAEQILLMEKNTRDEKTGLLYHAWNERRDTPWADPETGKSPEFWGRSMGWVGVAILDDLDFFPDGHRDRAEMTRAAADLLKALLPYQSADGRWYQVVDKPQNPDNWPENSCTCLYAAAIFKAARKGILPKELLKNAQRGYDGVIRSLTLDGDDLLIGNVCIGTGVGDYEHYIHRPTSVNDLHGVGAFLIMCAEAELARRAYPEF